MFFLHGSLHDSLNGPLFYIRNGLKNCSMSKPLYYAKLVLKKGKCLNVEKIMVLKFDKAVLKK